MFSSGLTTAQGEELYPSSHSIYSSLTLFMYMYICVQCRVVRNADPNFVWTLRRDDVLYRNRNMVASTIANHYAKASSFTTKVS